MSKRILVVEARADNRQIRRDTFASECRRPPMWRPLRSRLGRPVRVPQFG